MKHRTKICAVIVAGLLMMQPAYAQYQFKDSNRTGEIAQESNGDLKLSIDDKEKLRIKNSGLAIIQSGIQIGDDSSCGALTEGTLKYNSGTDTWAFCNGTGWQTLAFSGPGAACYTNAKSLKFKDQVNVFTSTLLQSEIIQVDTDACSSSVAIVGQGSPEYRICSNANCSTVTQNWTSTAGTISDGAYLQLRMTSSASYSTALTAGIVLGGAYDEWRTTTLPPPLKVFVTSQGYTASAIGGVGGADHHCNSLASAAGLTGRYRAWLNDSAATITTRFTQHTGPYIMPNGTIVANNWTDLTDGVLLAAIDRNESGTAVADKVWTNADIYGSFVSSTGHCAEWSNNAGSAAVHGTSNMLNGTWTNNTTNTCNQANRFYCFEQAAETLGTPGVNYKRVFVSSVGYPASSIGGITGADSLCQGLATTAGLSGTYKAWLADSTSGSAPDSRFAGVQVPHRNMAGDRIADTWVMFKNSQSFKHKAGINYDETGAFVNSARVWSNVDGFGSRKSSTGHCTNWTSNAGTASTTGITGAVSIQWTDGATNTCNQANRLICVEQ